MLDKEYSTQGQISKNFPQSRNRRKQNKIQRLWNAFVVKKRQAKKPFCAKATVCIVRAFFLLCAKGFCSSGFQAAACKSGASKRYLQLLVDEKSTQRIYRPVSGASHGAFEGKSVASQFIVNLWGNVTKVFLQVSATQRSLVSLPSRNCYVSRCALLLRVLRQKSSCESNYQASWKLLFWMAS